MKKLNNNFELLDKVVYVFCNFAKPIETYPISGSGSCSGSPSYIPNDKIIGVIYEIKEIKCSGYCFGDEYSQEGYYETITTQYYITGHSKPLQSYDLELYKK